MSKCAHPDCQCKQRKPIRLRTCKDCLWQEQADGQEACAFCPQCDCDEFSLEEERPNRVYCKDGRHTYITLKGRENQRTFCCKCGKSNCGEEDPDCEDPECEVHCEHSDGYDHGTCLSCGKDCTEDLAAKAEDMYGDVDR